MDIGKYVKVSEYEFVYDLVKKMWVERVIEVNLVLSGEVDSLVDIV